MDAVLELFRRRLYTEWLPVFCKDSERQFSLTGFTESSIRVARFDARNFMRALDNGVVLDRGGGRYLCPRSTAHEQLFWEGKRCVKPRPLSLWVEPIITIATMARLHLDLGWPVACLCMQPKGWALDFCVHTTPTADTGLIGGEVKKSARELDRLIDLIHVYARGGLSTEPTASVEKNAYRKWRALYEMRSPYFWAVGPDDYTRVFRMVYDEAGCADLVPCELSVLEAPVTLLRVAPDAGSPEHTTYPRKRTSPRLH